jgi:hypothetical protein
MRKTLFVTALLAGTLSLSASNASAAIVAKGKLLNQTAPITKTIYTPTATGLYRLSVYATVTVANPSSQSTWNDRVQWTDDSGVLSTQGLGQSGNALGPFFWFVACCWSIPLEVKAGTPITFSVTQSGPADNSAYSVYYTLERLE